MTDITIDLTGQAELIRRFSGADKVIREEVTTLVNRSSAAGERIAKDLVGKKTHHLERSITAVEGVWAGGTITASWGTNVPYARYHEEGTAPHVITAKNKPYLHFKTKSGNWVRAVSVNHPGTKARRYMKGSYDRIREALPRNAETTKLRIVQRLSAGGA